MSKLDEFKQMIAGMSVEELTEYFGGDSCENALCAFVGSNGFCCKGSTRYVEENKNRSCRECIETFLRMGD